MAYAPFHCINITIVVYFVIDTVGNALCERTQKPCSHFDSNDNKNAAVVETPPFLPRIPNTYFAKKNPAVTIAV